ncbi:unnamed protein product [Rodentolepis nana]|uniref:Uncharacterized protein n=1 Tax=Rodentolepis nana TaxID=102285 RepID=A0A0R3TZT9_RODNA|nr:unnamed protein product [Rodentolepis nana]
MLSFPTGSLHAYLLLLRELKLFNAPFHESLSYLKHTNPHLYYRFLSYFQNTTSLSDLRMPLEKPFSVSVHVPRDIPNLAWSFPKRTPSHLYVEMELLERKLGEAVWGIRRLIGEDESVFTSFDAPNLELHFVGSIVAVENHVLPQSPELGLEQEILDRYIIRQLAQLIDKLSCIYLNCDFLIEDGEEKDVDSKGESIEKMKEGETRPTTIAMLFEPPPPPIKSDSLPTISVTLMRSRRICDLPWYDREVMGSEAQYVLYDDEEATSGTICERRGGVDVEEDEDEEEEEEGSRRRDLRGTFEIKRLSDEKLEYGMEPEKTCLRESTLPHFILNCSCESEEEDEEEEKEEEEELTTNSPHPSILDTEGMSSRLVTNSLRIFSASTTSPSTTRRQWFKGLRSRLRRVFLCCNAIEED